MIFGTPSLILARWWTKQCAITTAHQRQTSLHQTDGPAAQFMSLPGALRDALSAEQHLGDDSIRCTVHISVEGAQRQGQALAPLRRNLMKGRSRWTAVDGAPQPMRGMRANFEIWIERQFGRVGSTKLRRLFQPQLMLRSLNAQHGVPAVGCLSNAA